MNDPEGTQSPKPEPETGQDEIVDESSTHVSADQLALFVTGRLDPTESQAVQTHVASCNQCVTRINGLSANIASFVADLNQDSVQPKATQLPNSETIDQSLETSPHTTASDPAESGTFGDYELINEIARGGMGVVYKARQKSLNRIVALKMIKSGELANQEQVDRFYKEAEAAANLDHPGIVPVQEVGEVNGQHYFTMGFVDGDSLADRLRNGPLPPKEAARYAKSIAEAVAFAHSKGVVHRDLKPGNVLITKEGTLRITDFGLAKRIEDDSELTSTGQVLGTPSYMPPEQAEGRLSEIGPAADTYAIGATLYCMLVGRPPFQAANLIETLQQVIHTEPVSLKVQNPGVPTDLETLCLTCLEKKPSSRYLTSQELVDELNRFLNGEPIQARPIGKVERALRWCKRKPLAASLLGAIVILAIGGPWAAIAQSLANRRIAVARVDTLLNATPATIPLVLEELDRNASIVDSRLRELDSKDLAPEQRIRVSLALLPYDSSQVSKLKNLLNDCTYEELDVLLVRLRNYGGDSIVEELWTAFRDNELTEEQRFRTGIALAALDPDSENWEDGDYDFLVNSMLAVNTVYQPAVRRSLAPIASQLVGAVKSAYDSAEPDTLADESSANAIVDFAEDDTDLLIELSSSASPKQHSVVFPMIETKSKTDESVVDNFIEITRQQPKADDDEPTRIKLGKKRAGAAINLIRLKEPVEALEALRVKDDPESMTQFVHGCKARGITVEQLLDLLNRATTVSERYGILLALGEFPVTDIAEEIRSTWVDYVKDLCANDPSSGIHGASGWLLRQWGLTEEAKPIEEREMPYSKDREWFTLKIKLSGPLGFEKYSYFTFVVFRAGKYQIGSPEYETTRDSDETVHTVKLSRDFAVLDREITRGEYESFKRIGGIEGFSKTQDSAMVGTNWYNAVQFCRWLSEVSGLSEDDQCYGSPSELIESGVSADPSASGVPRDWPLDLSKSGFRLLTESEWEVACRAGVVSRYAFGCGESYLVDYGWYQTNSGRTTHVGRARRPNQRGLFDMHGNVNEWCHDWHESNPSSTDPDPLGESSGQARVSRGGGWSTTGAGCRSAARTGFQPTFRSTSFGFRLALVPLGAKSSEASQ